MQNARVVGSWRLLPSFQRKVWKARQYEVGSVFLQSAPESTLHKTVNFEVKAAVEIPECVTSGMPGMCNIFLGKLQAMNGVQIKREAMGVANGKALGAGLPKTVGTHIMTKHTSEDRHGIAEFNVCPAEFLFCFDLILPCCLPGPPFLNRKVYSVQLHIGSI
jgi:hypothetical protein